MGSLLNNEDIVIYESTVYPGATEEVCVPVTKMNRILNIIKVFAVIAKELIPGDKNHTLTSIKKVISGSNKQTTNFVKRLYEKIITAGVHEVSSIPIAEAAKVIENTQRDVNIALINELS